MTKIVKLKKDEYIRNAWCEVSEHGATFLNVLIEKDGQLRIAYYQLEDFECPAITTIFSSQRVTTDTLVTLLKRKLK